MMRRALGVLIAASALVARGGVEPVAESEQAAKALAIIDAYKGPRPVSAERKLILVYYTPSDRGPEPGYEERLGAIMEDIRGFYRDGMARLGFGPMSFEMERDTAGKPLLHVVKGTNMAAEFAAWKSRAGTGSPEDGEMVKASCRPALRAEGIEWDKETEMIFCNLAFWDDQARTFRHRSPYFGQYSLGHGLCFAADSRILDVADFAKREPTIHDEEYGDLEWGKFETIFIGGIAHELGHAFALPHCGERGDEAAMGVSIMGAGNHYYRAERRGERGAILTMASGMRLASHPLFYGTGKGWGDEPRLERCDFNVSTSGRRGTLRIDGRASGTPPVYGVVAYCNSTHDEYHAPTATTVPDAEGNFAVEISDLAACEEGEARIEFCHANGAVSERKVMYAVGKDGAVDLSQWQTRQLLAGLGAAVERGDRAAAAQELAAVERTDGQSWRRLSRRSSGRRCGRSGKRRQRRLSRMR